MGVLRECEKLKRVVREESWEEWYSANSGLISRAYRQKFGSRPDKSWLWLEGIFIDLKAPLPSPKGITDKNEKVV